MTRFFSLIKSDFYVISLHTYMTHTHHSSYQKQSNAPFPCDQPQHSSSKIRSCIQIEELLYGEGFSTFFYTFKSVSKLPASFLCYSGSPSQNLIMHRSLASTICWPYCGHPSSPSAQTFTILTDQLNYKTPFSFQSFHAPIHLQRCHF